MNMRDLIPWTRSQDQLPEFFRDERSSPFLTLHREMNRLLEEAFRGFASTSLGGRRTDFVNPAWPKLEVAETEKQITVSAEIPGMEEKDVEVLLNDGNLILRGEMKSETEDKEHQFSERFYGRFERQIPVGLDIDENKIEASFKNGILKIVLPKTNSEIDAPSRILNGLEEKVKLGLPVGIQAVSSIKRPREAGLKKFGVKKA